MGIRKSPRKASGREKNWDKVFNAIVELSKNLEKDRECLVDRIKSLHEVIYKMKMEQKVESVKADLVLGLREKEAFNYKHRYENAESELADFREWFDYLSQKCEEPKDISDDVSNKGEGSRNKALQNEDISDDVSNKGKGSRNKALQNEVRKLKSEIEKCKLDKNTEISALLEEKNFIWNQFKKMESDLNKEIRKKDDEFKHANEKLQLSLNREDELQVSNEKLRTDFAKMESESVQKSEEIFRLLKEIELLKSRSGSATPLLRLGPCRGGKSRTSDGGVIKVKKEADSSQTFEKMARIKQSAHKSTGGKAPMKQFITKGGSSSSSSKRKAVDFITIPDSPKLFNSSFKVPKLKSSAASPQIV